MAFAHLTHHTHTHSLFIALIEMPGRIGLDLDLDLDRILGYNTTAQPNT
jgi:hypothetical protein